MLKPIDGAAKKKLLRKMEVRWEFVVGGIYNFPREAVAYLWFFVILIQ